MKIRYIFIDVDGTLTDGGVYYDEHGNEIKKFNTKDGTGIILARTSGITPIILTGRTCFATSRRMLELGVEHLYQGINNKTEWIRSWMSDNSICKEEVGYIGDDINDLGSMKLCGFVACPLDAIDEVKNIANYIASINGGQGVVREVIRYILQKQGRLEETITAAYETGI